MDALQMENHLESCICLCLQVTTDGYTLLNNQKPPENISQKRRSKSQ
jgi:hypothetical protein